MAIPLIPAMTAAEIRSASAFPPRIAYLGCRFSASGPGLTQFPPKLPPASTVILTDQVPVGNQDPSTVIRQLWALEPERLLLDLQRPPTAEAISMVSALVRHMPCPVGVSAAYANGLSCPVFLPPIPPHLPPAQILQPWQSREVWLELALDAVEISVTPRGSTQRLLPFAKGSPDAHIDTGLHCHYTIRTEPELIRFYLYRTPEDLQALAQEAIVPGVTCAFGLFHELF